MKAGRRQVPSLPALGLALLLAGATACLDSSSPEPTPLAPLPGLVVSAPVLGPGGAAASVPSAAFSFGSSASETVVYISLAPGSVPDGMEARIRDQATGQSVTTQVVNGGFDPVALAASVGDTVTVDIVKKAVS